MIVADSQSLAAKLPKQMRNIVRFWLFRQYFAYGAGFKNTHICEEFVVIEHGAPVYSLSKQTEADKSEHEYG